MRSSASPHLSSRQRALVDMGAWLRTRGYSFATITPESHRRVNERSGHDDARDLRGIFGWSRPFDAAILPREVLGLLLEADALEPASPESARGRSRVRFSSLDGGLFVHSAFPTEGADSVFFGPDTYRFTSFALREVARLQLAADHVPRVVEIGCGTGATGLTVARALGRCELVLADVNERALELAAVNAALAEVDAICIESDVLDSVDGVFDLIVANPPYLVDAAARAYRDGGSLHGGALSLRIARESLERLAPGGSFLLYTGSAIVAGVDELRAQLELAVRERGATMHYGELDPDVFGEELSGAGYADVERIAAVGMVATLPLSSPTRSTPPH